MTRSRLIRGLAGALIAAAVLPFVCAYGAFAWSHPIAFAVSICLGFWLAGS